MAKKKTPHAGGRPPVYKPKHVRHIQSLIRKHGLTHTQRILQAGPGTVLAKNRNDVILVDVLKPLKKISMPTLQKFRQAADIEVAQGRPTNEVKEKRAA